MTPHLQAKRCPQAPLHHLSLEADVNGDCRRVVDYLEAHLTGRNDYDDILSKEEIVRAMEGKNRVEVNIGEGFVAVLDTQRQQSCVYWPQHAIDSSEDDISGI